MSKFAFALVTATMAVCWFLPGQGPWEGLFWGVTARWEGYDALQQVVVSLFGGMSLLTLVMAWSLTREQA